MSDEDFISNQWWTDPKTGKRWNVHFEWTVIGTRAEPARVDVIAYKGNYVTAEVVRRIPLGTIIAEQRISYRKMLAKLAGDMSLTARERREYEHRSEQFGPRSGRALGDEELEAVAKVYRDAFQAPKALKTPVVKAVAAAFHVSESAAAKRIAAARARGFLGAAVGTKAGEHKIGTARVTGGGTLATSGARGRQVEAKKAGKR